MFPADAPTRAGLPRRGLLALKAGLLGAALALSFACQRGDETDRVRAVIAEGSARAEGRDLEGLLSLATEGLRADPGQRNRDEVREILAAAFYHYRRFRILHPQAAVELSDDGSSARASLPFLIVREERSYPGLEELSRDPKGWLERVGENADLYHLSLELAKGESGWRVAAARLNSYRGPAVLP